MNIPDNIKVTSEVLWRGAIFFASIDFVLVAVLTRYVKPQDFFKVKRKLIIIMAVYFCFLFGTIMSLIFWDSVYSYVFPSWLRWIIPPCYGLLFSLIGLFSWWLAVKLPGKPVVSFCISGGLWGLLTHILAIHRGILDKPPMLQGASSVAALTVAAFEFIFYWCICLGFTFLIDRIGTKLFSHSDKIIDHE